VRSASRCDHDREKAADYACALAAGLKVWVLGFEQVFGAASVPRPSSS
jgi:hypothetical protein